MRTFGDIVLVIITIFLVLSLTNEELDFSQIVDEINSTVNTNIKSLEKDEVRISRVVDGDTVITINDKGKEERIRLLLIDTPESVHPTKPVEPFGLEASKFAKEYIENAKKEGKTFKLERGNPEKDRYDRVLAYLWVGDVNFNQLMLEKGFARVAYVFEPNTKYLNEFKKSEQKAKEKGIGIWSIPNHVTDKGFNSKVEIN